MGLSPQTLSIATKGAGLYEITAAVAGVVQRSRAVDGIVNIFCQHTSCSLVIMENADISARRDLERWLDRLVPENDPMFTHVSEGADDMPSHIKMALGRTAESVPFASSRLLLGTWQGIFLWEHRRTARHRSIVVTVIAT